MPSYNYVKKILAAIINQRGNNPIVGVKAVANEVAVYPLNNQQNVKDEIARLANFQWDDTNKCYYMNRQTFEQQGLLNRLDDLLAPMGIDVLYKEDVPAAPAQAQPEIQTVTETTEDGKIPVTVERYQTQFTPKGSNYPVKGERLHFSIPPQASQNQEVIQNLKNIFNALAPSADSKAAVTYDPNGSAKEFLGRDGFVFMPAKKRETLINDPEDENPNKRERRTLVVFPFSKLKLLLDQKGFKLMDLPAGVINGTADEEVAADEARMIAERIEQQNQGVKIVHIQRRAAGTGKDQFVITFPVRPEQNPEFYKAIKGQEARMRGLLEQDPANNSSVLTYKLRTVQDLVELIRMMQEDEDNKWQIADWEIDTSVLDEAQSAREAQMEQFAITPPEIKQQLMPGADLEKYQNEAVDFMDKTNGNCFIGDQTGTGKTLQTIAWNIKNGNKVLVITKNENVLDWIDQSLAFFPQYFRADGKRTYAKNRKEEYWSTLVGEVNSKDFGPSTSWNEPVRKQNLRSLADRKKLVVMPYHLLARGWKSSPEEYAADIQKYMQKHNVTEQAARRYVKIQGDGRWRIETLKECGFNTIIFDESAHLRTAGIRTSKVAEEVSRWDGMEHHICQSGSPIFNRVEDWLGQLKMLVTPEDFRKLEAEIKAMAKDPGKLENFLHKYLLARTKADLLPYLPEKTTQNVDIEMVGVDEEKYPKPKNLGEYSKIKKQVAIDKALATAKYCEGLLADTDESMLVYTDSPVAANIIYEYLNKTTSLAGKVLKHLGSSYKGINAKYSMDPEEKIQARRLFDDVTKDYRVFVISRGSMSEGTNLQKASLVVFNDIPWSPAQIIQAEDRTHRKNQKNAVRIHWLSARNISWDRYMQAIVRKKYIKNKALSNLQENVGMTEKEMLAAIEKGDSKFLIEKCKIRPDEVAFLEEPVPYETLGMDILDRLEKERIRLEKEAKAAGNVDQEQIEEQINILADQLIAQAEAAQVPGQAEARYYKQRIIIAARRKKNYELR